MYLNSRYISTSEHAKNGNLVSGDGREAITGKKKA
jgi:hypothetical protein